MSVKKLAAPVRATYFADLDIDERMPGAFTYYTSNGDDNEQPIGLIYVCPCGCGVHGSLAFVPEPGRASWKWDGNREQPTLTPSIHHVDHWHGYLRGGVFTDA